MRCDLLDNIMKKSVNYQEDVKWTTYEAYLTSLSAPSPHMRPATAKRPSLEKSRNTDWTVQSENRSLKTCETVLLSNISRGQRCTFWTQEWEILHDLMSSFESRKEIFHELLLLFHRKISFDEKNSNDNRYNFSSRKMFETICKCKFVLWDIQR